MSIVHRLTRLVDMMLEQQRMTNAHLSDLLDFLGEQFGYAKKKERLSAVELETPYVKSNDDVVVAAQPKKSKTKRKNKKKKR